MRKERHLLFREGGSPHINEVCKILKDIGFIASAKNKDKDYQFFSSSSKETKEGDVHIHLSIIHTNRFKEFILIKEYLLKNKDEAQKYSNFKRKISRDKIERNEYKRIKSKYVSELLERAKIDKGGTTKWLQQYI